MSHREAGLGATLFVDPAGVVTHASGSVRALFGQEAAGAHLDDLLHGLDWAAAGARGGRHAATAVGFGDAVDVEIRTFVEGDHLVLVTSAERTSDVPSLWDRRISPLGVPLEEGFVAAQRAFVIAVLDADPNLVFVKDAEGRFLFVNAAMARDFGLAPEAMVAQPNAAVHPHERELETFASVDREVLEAGREVVVEEPFTLPSGDVLWYETRKRPLVAPDGKTYVLAVATDVTARRAAERTLEETRERLGLAVKAGRLGVWDWNVVTGEVYFDAEYKAMLGYDDHDFANRFDAWYEALHPDDRDRALVHVERAVADPRAHDFEHEFRLRTKAGEYRWIFGAATITRDDTGRATRVTGFHSDVHDRKAREDALRAANEGLARAARMKDEFLANMSHELRTPLNGVLGHAELLAEEVHGPLSDAQRRAVATIEASGLHLLRLINDVLDLARLEAGKLELVRQNVDVSELCQRALANVRREALHKSLKVAFAEKGIARPLLADPRRCEQMVASLLENAVRFTPTGGRIGLEVHAGEDALAITVWDTGIGVPPGEVDRIFQPFVQLDGGLARQHGGTGLGLPLVRRLAELHGGSLRVETAEGAGSRFVLTLPHAPASRPPQ